MKITFVVLLIVVRASVLLGQTDNIGSGRAIRFDGIDDYIDLGNTYDNLTIPFTISAWVYIDPDAGPCPIFVSQGQDNTPVYKGFWFFVSPVNLWIEYGDGAGGNNSAFRKGKTAPIGNLTGRWIHVCAVMKGGSNIDLYVNGINVGGASSGGSNLPMSSNYPNEVAKIGYLVSNGVTYRFKGKIDEIHFFNRALTQTEIRQNMTKKLNGNEAGLIGYWTFNETTGSILIDKSANHFDGQLKGNPNRIYSGAPIGDENVFSYSNNWNGFKFNMQDGLHQVEVANVNGNPSGVHIYEVRDLPSQTGGLNLSSLEKPYFGVFVANLTGGKSFDINYKYDNNIGFCDQYTRMDNSVSAWGKASLVNINDRIEFVKMPSGAGNLNVYLGSDQVVCDQSSFVLSTNIDPTGKTFLWNTGQNTPSITVTQSNKYSVQVSESCKTAKDSIQITFLNTPPTFSLGVDQEVCSMVPILLSPLNNNTSGFDFTWQDGSKNPAFLVKDYGTYWVNVKNECGSEIDSVIFKNKQVETVILPNVITPNLTDNLNNFFLVDDQLKFPQLFIYNRWGRQVYHSSHYSNNWDGDDLSDGVYFYKIIDSCFGEFKGTVSILR